MDYPAGIRAKGNSIEIRYQWKGKRYREILQKRPNKTNLAHTVRIRQDRIERLKHGLVAEEIENPSFATIAQRFLNDSEIAVSTRESYKNILNRYWIPFLGGQPIRIIKYSTLAKIAADVNWPSQKTKKNALIPLRGVFNIALHDDIIDANPVIKFKSIKPQKPEIQPFTADEKEAILKQLAGDEYLYFLLAFEGGFRPPGEIIALKWSDYDGESLSISKAIVRRKLKNTTKTNKPRRTLLTKRAIKALNNHHTRFKDDYIFLNTLDGPHLDGDHFNTAWKIALNDAEVPYRRGYNCRHTYASLGLTAGAKPAFLAKQLGHSLDMFFRTYAKWIESKDDKLELQKIEMGQKWARENVSD